MRNVVLYYGGKREITKYSPRAEDLSRVFDFGSAGRYFSHDRNITCEWACKDGKDGVLNKVTFQFGKNDASILNLYHPQWTIMHWLSVILTWRYRSFENSEVCRYVDMILEDFRVPLAKTADITVANRADDRMFAYIDLFLSDALRYGAFIDSQLAGGFGPQVYLRTQKGFDCITGILAPEDIKAINYAGKYDERFKSASREFDSIFTSQQKLEKYRISDIYEERKKLSHDLFYAIEDEHFYMNEDVKNFLDMAGLEYRKLHIDADDLSQDCQGTYSENADSPVSSTDLRAENILAHKNN